MVAAPTVVEDEDETTIDLRQFRPVQLGAAFKKHWNKAEAKINRESCKF